MFILDEETVVQQVTLNNLAVSRSVLEALRLLETFQVVASHGVLCPIDWKPSDNTNDIAANTSNTLTESYEDRLANLQKEFGDTVVTNLDANRKLGGTGKENSGSEEHMKGSAQGSFHWQPQDEQHSHLGTTLVSLKGPVNTGRDGNEPSKSGSNDAVQARASVTPTHSRRPFKSQNPYSAPQTVATPSR
ncbi:hypothetical protein DPSP01_013980 [Paraphaeosphaeria sporulosa]